MTSNFQTSLQKINRLQSFIALFLLCALLTILTDKFFTPENGLNVLRQVAVNICISVGMTLIVLTAGIDLSVGSVLALCSAVAVGLFKEGRRPHRDRAHNARYRDVPLKYGRAEP